MGTFYEMIFGKHFNILQQNSLKLLRLSLLSGLLFLAPAISFAQSHPDRWLEAKAVATNCKAVADLKDIEVFSAPNTIMVKVNHQTQIRLFTILGKIIHEQRLNPGIYEFHLDSHGIFIIKTDESSCKVAI